MPPPLPSVGGRTDLFAVLQQHKAEDLPGDVWIGNPLINPLKGKGHARPPSNGRKHNLFDVLHAGSPGQPSDDSWLGNPKVDPSRGKAHPEGPEQRRGRRDLTDVFTQSILHETVEKRHELMKRGADPLADGWMGHPFITPGSGKAAGEGGGEGLMMGATFRGETPHGYTDMPKRLTKAVPPPRKEIIKEVLDGSQAGVSDFSRRGKKLLPEYKGDLVIEHDMYANMTFKPLSEKETKVFSRAVHDGKSHKPKKIPPEGGGRTSHDLLQHKPQIRVGSHIPYGGLAQEARGARVQPAAAAAQKYYGGTSLLGTGTF